MSQHNIRIDLGAVDFGSLHCEADYWQEATRLLPKVLTDLGQAQGEIAWEGFQRAFSGAGFKVNRSTSDRQKFIREAGENFRTGVDAIERAKIVDCIADQLKEQATMRATFNDKEKKVLRFLEHVFLTDGGSPQYMSGPGGATKIHIMDRCTLNEPEYRKVIGRFEYLGLVKQCGPYSQDEWVAINNSVLEAVRSMDETPAPPQASTIHNTVNVGTMHSSAIQQGSPGATQSVTITAHDRDDVEKILTAVAGLLGQLSPTYAEELQDEVDTIKLQLKKQEPKRSIIKECLGTIQTSLTSIATKAIASGSALAATDIGHQIAALVASWHH